MSAPDSSPQADVTVDESGDEIAEHFTEATVAGVDRLYHSHPTAPYPFPADTPEKKRIKREHQILNRLLGGNIPYPISSVLEGDESRLVVDLGTGTGQWVMEMADEYPQVIFHGLDIVSIAPHHNLPNVHFEIHDLNEQTQFMAGSVDLVHARSVALAVRDYRTIIREAGRLLRPGGVFLCGEWLRYPNFDMARFPGTTPQRNAPALTRFFETWNEALHKTKGITQMEHEIPKILLDSGFFTSVTSKPVFVPIGDWREELPMKAMGRQFRDCMRRYLDSTKRLMLESGQTNQVLDTMIANAWHELSYVEGMGGIYFWVAAVKI